MSSTPNLRIPLKRGPKPQSFIEDSPVTSDDPADFESHVVLRVPEDCVHRIESIIASDGKVEDFSLCLNSDARNATIRIGNQLLNGKVLDLPTVTEVHKTMDKRNLYKVADVSQMIVCTHDSINTPSSTASAGASAEGEGTEAAAKAAKKVVKQWQYPHGLTPPMKCARKKRFRKTKKKKFMDAPEVEKELKRLLREDLAADIVKWEIVDGDKDGGADEGGSRSQRHVTYPSSSEDDSDVGDEEKEE
ncbi:unnamed protein product [Caenorhabditis sp. 36 PRJEB53466]|nr:unnamed protein product [Caenorhabditis sp. 36 PRJEB53466]